MFETPSIHRLEEAIASPSNPIGMRMRAAYFLRQVYDQEQTNAASNPSNNNTRNPHQERIDRVIDTLGKGLENKQHGSLMRHEFAYVMGQLRDEKCCDMLEQTLADNDDCVMVRHECAEALGAIGADRSIPILKKAMKDNKHKMEIYQTCEIAIAHMEWRIQKHETNQQQPQEKVKHKNKEEDDDDDEPMACACMISPYSSIDPAPPHPKHIHLSTETLGTILRDTNLPLFERYRAMFSLRNRGGEECVLELGQALIFDDSSALLRHEIAYVLGQMQHPSAIYSLGQSLRRSNEHEMVRHESAEALGAIDANADQWNECENLLHEFAQDEDIVVRESCLVALDAADYWGHLSHSNDTSNDNCNDNIHENQETNMNDSCPETLSFVLQKAITNGKTNCRGKQDSIMNHFNVQI